MNHPAVVRIGERVRDARDDSHGRGDAELFFALQASPECLTPDERHDVIQKAPTRAIARVPGFATVEERQQIGMLQLRRDLDLAQEPLGAEYRAELRVEDFERDVPVVLRVAGEIDRGHSSASNFTLEDVRGAQTLLQLIADCAHAWQGSSAANVAVAKNDARAAARRSLYGLTTRYIHASPRDSRHVIVARLRSLETLTMFDTCVMGPTVFSCPGPDA